MAVIDFSEFVNELARVSGQAILPFFRSALAAAGALPARAGPVTASDPEVIVSVPCAPDVVSDPPTNAAAALIVPPLIVGLASTWSVIPVWT